VLPLAGHKPATNWTDTEMLRRSKMGI
jgi:hypothetical protein